MPIHKKQVSFYHIVPKDRCLMIMGKSQWGEGIHGIYLFGNELNKLI